MEKHPLSYEGRISRLSYWSRFAICMIILILAFYFLRRDPILVLIQMGLQLVISIFMWIQAIKRIHDVNKSGWYFLIPFYGFVLLFVPGTKGKNDYGEDPRNEEGILNG